MKDADSTSASEPSRAAAKTYRQRGFRPVVWFAIIAATVVVIDQITKFIAENALATGQRIDLVGDLLGLRLVYNAGAAFSFGTGATWLLSILATAVAVVIIRIAPRVTSFAWVWALSLLLGGAVGNLVDRFFKAPGFPQGHVVDFIDYGIFVGNVADIAIVLAAIFMVFLGVRGVDLEAPRHADDNLHTASASPDNLHTASASPADADSASSADTSETRSNSNASERNEGPTSDE